MNTNIYDGLIVMCIGVSTVLTFLCILIFAMSIMSKVVGWLNKIFPEPVQEVAGSKKANNASADDATALAILTAFLRKK